MIGQDLVAEFTSVSYTHLVQRGSQTILLWLGWAGTVYAVSYTHLDVYKRQAVHLCPTDYLGLSNVPLVIHYLQPSLAFHIVTTVY